MSIEVIRQINQRLRRAFQQGDAVAVAALYAADGELLPAHAEVIAGRPAIEAYWRGAMSAGVAEVIFDTREVKGGGESLSELGSYRLCNASGALLDYGKYLAVWRRQGTDWLLDREIWTTSQPEANPPAQ